MGAAGLDEPKILKYIYVQEKMEKDQLELNFEDVNPKRLFQSKWPPRRTGDCLTLHPIYVRSLSEL